MMIRSMEKYLFSSNMKNIFFSLVCIVLCTGSAAEAQIGGTAGSFSRLGFGARGMGMGNALTAVNTGDISTYYNPALAAFSEGRTASATFGLLSLDRYLNFLSFTQSLRSQAGFSLGLINSGVRNIDGRDAETGQHTDYYSTTENQFYLAFANRVEEHVSLGVSIKLLYSKLFEQVTSSTVGFDVGGCVVITKQLSLGAVIQDINSKYKWNTAAYYGPVAGRATQDNFPVRRRIGLAYRLPEESGLVSAEFENTSDGTNSARFGAEYSLVSYFTVRGGADRWEFGDNATGVKPTFGFTARRSFERWTPALTYAFVVEGYSPHGMHIITLSTMF
jgi:hypothetical protein